MSTLFLFFDFSSPPRYGYIVTKSEREKTLIETEASKFSADYINKLDAYRVASEAGLEALREQGKYTQKNITALRKKLFKELGLNDSLVTGGDEEPEE